MEEQYRPFVPKAIRKHIGEWDKYSIFIVQNTDKSYAKLIPINNPVKMWLEDKLLLNKIELTGLVFSRESRKLDIRSNKSVVCEPPK